MGLQVKHRKGATAEAAANDEGEEEESEDEFEERIYDALMKLARGSSAKLRSALGSCVMMGTGYEQAPENVREAIRLFIDEADL